ncbi:kinase-like domain-containing protein [Elsinoe ampelina]|uniref:Kinase-like domain-containing protein n=1 Tax=Elsinoe ampelina TaxID=302913 RepID=A0A6A6GL57_9PEZI|nr:kinase-like domain-containing protein [Elsinoe ampelina]
MPAMDIDQPESDRVDLLKQSARIASPLRKVEHPDGAIAVAELPGAAVNPPKARATTKGRKKKGAMTPGDPAVNVVRGFETPVLASADESDISRGGSPLMRPVSFGGVPMSRQGSNQSGISMLKAQLDTLSLDDANRSYSLSRTDSNIGSEYGGTSSVVSGDSDRTEIETYEVPLEHDFISPDANASARPSPRIGPIEGGLRSGSIHRKMAANDFQRLHCLGKGAFGTVFLVKQKATGRLFAQKQFRKASLVVHRRLVEQTRTERSILESVNRHPFVVKLFYAFQDQEKLYLILEYAQGGELFTHLAMERMFPEDTAAFYMAELVLALEHLHTNVRVVYRDLKPENCLLDTEGHLLLTDFGLSKVAVDDDDHCNSVLGTIEYMAPEVIQGINYGMAVDWWSLGAIGFDMLTGSPPFAGGNNAKIQQNILKQKLQMPYFLGPDAKDLLTRLLRKEPNKRLGYHIPKDIQTIKKHRFFRKIDWRKLEKRELTPPIQPLITDPELAENFAKEFTDLPLHPTVDMKVESVEIDPRVAMENDPFGGFSFVASQSLLETESWLIEN